MPPFNFSPETQKRIDQFGINTGKALLGGFQTAAGTAVVAGTAIAASKVYDALTKGRDFRKMMKSSFNEDLHEHYQDNPERFDEMFTGLRQADPSLTKNPIAAGMYMRRAFSHSVNEAGGVLNEARMNADKHHSPFMEMVMRAAESGVSHGLQEALRDQGQLEMEARKPQLELDILNKTRPLALKDMGIQHKLQRNLETHKDKLRNLSTEQAEGRRPQLEYDVLSKTQPLRRGDMDYQDKLRVEGLAPQHDLQKDLETLKTKLKTKGDIATARLKKKYDLR